MLMLEIMNLQTPLALSPLPLVDIHAVSLLGHPRLPLWPGPYLDWPSRGVLLIEGDRSQDRKLAFVYLAAWMMIALVVLVGSGPGRATRRFLPTFACDCAGITQGAVGRPDATW